MAYVNVAEWSTLTVCDWLKGLDDSMNTYVRSFTNNEVRGHQLLNIRPYELEQLGMHAIGHQEIVLEAVEHLRNFHFNLDKENLQFLALHVATASRSLYKQLEYYGDKSKIETQILNDITRTIATIKPLVTWLDRSPFQGQSQFNEIRKNMLRLGLEMATSAQRDRFVENPVDQIRMTADKLAKLADYIIQDITDPMLLQPASLNLVTIKKRDSELGFNIMPSYHGMHRVSDIMYNSPAHNSGKIEDGDEIVQINYQTVVGWQYKTVILLLRESSPDVLLTLKKRPKHTKIYGQIYMKPYRLPSKKRAMPHRWGENLPSPRADFLTVQEFTLPLKISEKVVSSDTDSSCSDILTPTDTKSVDKEIRLYLPKPRAVLQRRNTICGDELSSFKSIGNVPLWHERKCRQNDEASSPSLRDKSVSFGFGLELTPRPNTCLELSSNGMFNDLKNLKNSLIDIPPGKTKPVPGPEENGKSNHGVSKVVRFDANMETERYQHDNKYMCNVDNTILETFEPIPYVDEEDVIQTLPEVPIENEKMIKERFHPMECRKSESEPPQTCSHPVPAARRGKLDKSYSTPAYDTSEEDPDTPPAIEPRKEFLHMIPPAPPPRPKKSTEIQPPAVPPPPPKPISLSNTQQLYQQPQQPAPSTPPINISPSITITQQPSPSASVFHLQHHHQPETEESELLTPVKTKSLTLKKKSSLLAKRRKISLKTLGTSNIQGHLYRRTKDKRGVTFWAKLYFVLVETFLYGFRTKESLKANCMVFLPGFTVSLAKEVHSKSFAFKVYHPLKTFYFAAETVEALNQWMEFIRVATITDKSVMTQESCSDQKIKEFFSETDSSGDESDLSFKQLCTPSPLSNSASDKSIRETFGRDTSGSFTTPTSSKHEKYFGSLKKFTKTTLPFKSSSDKKQSSDIPVPTAQFRSYRKVPGGCYGLQIGTNSPPITQAELTPPPHFETCHRKQSITSINSVVETYNRSLVNSSSVENDNDESENDRNEIMEKSKKIRKTSPYNYIHASNPNLVEFDFHTSKSLDFSLPKINSSNSWDAQNLQGCVTLKDLMLRKQEEEAKDMYNNRVYLGVEKKDENIVKPVPKKTQNGEGHPTGTGKLSKIQSRSLPKTPDYEMSFKPDDEDIKRMRTKEGLKLRDFGYEFIYGDEPSDAAQKYKTAGRSNSHSQVPSYSKKKYSLSNVSEVGDKIHYHNSNSSSSSSRGGSFKKTKGKFEAFKTSSERLFQFKNSSHDGATGSLKSTSYAPLTLPLNKKSSMFFNVENAHGLIKKSQTYNSEFKDQPRKVEPPRKNSAPAPIFSKFSFSSGSKTAKERKLLGSPRLHRAIFGRTHSTSGQPTDLDHEIFCPITFPKINSSNVEAEPDIEPPERKASIVVKSHTAPTYPNLECPPVFEPETYSLSDPNASLTLLRRRSHLESE